jgi:hypothetical protein
MKSKRIAARQAELDIAVSIRNLNKMQGGPPQAMPAGFIRTTEEIDTECRRQRLLHEANIAQNCNYDRKKFRQMTANR